MITVKEINVNAYITKSKLPDADFVINPYIGCTHKCIYCYAEFMKRFTNHNEDWGDFIDVKLSSKPMKLDKMKNKTILIGSVTDAYNPYEKKHQITRKILEQLVNCNSHIEVLTKSDLVLRDIDLFKQIKDFRIGISLNTLDDSFRKSTEPFASSVERRINALRVLHENGIETYLFMSPIFPGITDFKKLINETKEYVDSFCFENLNLRGAYSGRVLSFIDKNYNHLNDIYTKIYKKKDMTYWESLSTEINDFCSENKLNHKLYFYHEKIKKP
ncbi:MAG: radical SAM protein [Ignavibacteriaceae bacterium]|nr:radical SAM protein [Ignavibacteriaceae bacterium]